MQRNPGNLSLTLELMPKMKLGILGVAVCYYKVSTAEKESRGILGLASQIVKPNQHILYKKYKKRVTKASTTHG